MILKQLLCIVNELFSPALLNHRMFEFSNRKSTRITYYLCAIVVLLLAIWNRVQYL